MPAVEHEPSAAVPLVGDRYADRRICPLWTTHGQVTDLLPIVEPQPVPWSAHGSRVPFQDGI
jgi:hypothetical protein